VIGCRGLVVRKRLGISGRRRLCSPPAAALNPSAGGRANVIRWWNTRFCPFGPARSGGPSTRPWRIIARNHSRQPRDWPPPFLERGTPPQSIFRSQGDAKRKGPSRPYSGPLSGGSSVSRRPGTSISILLDSDVFRNTGRAEDVVLRTRTAIECRQGFTLPLLRTLSRPGHHSFPSSLLGGASHRRFWLLFLCNRKAWAFLLLALSLIRCLWSYLGA